MSGELSGGILNTSSGNLDLIGRDILNMIMKSANQIQENSSSGIYTHKGCLFIATGSMGTQANSVYTDCVTDCATLGAQFTGSTHNKCLFTVADWVGGTKNNCQFEWTPPTWPAWNAAKEQWEFHDILSGVSDPPLYGTSPYSGYATDLWGNKRYGIGACFMPSYVDLASGTDSHAGTQADPYSWTDFKSSVSAKTSIHYYLKGSKDTTDWLTWPGDKTGFEFLPWNLSVNGPFRIRVTSTISGMYGIWKNGIVFTTNNNTYTAIATGTCDLRTMFLKATGGISIQNTGATGKGCIFVANNIQEGGTFIDCILSSPGWGSPD